MKNVLLYFTCCISAAIIAGNILESCSRKTPQFDTMSYSDLFSVYRKDSDDKPVKIDTNSVRWIKLGINGNTSRGYVVRKTYRYYDRVECPLRKNGISCLAVHYGYTYRTEAEFLDSLKRPMTKPSNK